MGATVEGLDPNNMRDGLWLIRIGADGNLAITFKIHQGEFVEARHPKGTVREAFIRDHKAVETACLRAYERTRKTLKVMDYAAIVMVTKTDFSSIPALP